MTCLSLTLAGVLAPGAAAHAAPVAAQPVVRYAEVAKATIASRTVRGDKLSATNVAVRANVQKHLDESATAGQLVDLQQVNTVSVPDPITPGHTIDGVWHGHRDVQAVFARQVDLTVNGSTASRKGVGVRLEPDGVVASVTSREPTLRGIGSGFEGAAASGYRKAFSGNGTWTWTPSYGTLNGFEHDNRMNSAYEDWERDGTPYYIYNRWGSWTLAKPTFLSGVTASTVDFSIDSKPWAGTRNKFLSMGPIIGNPTPSQCTETMTLGFSYGGGSISVPFHRCTSTTIQQDSNTMLMGKDWDGSTSQQLFLDVSAGYTAINSTVQLVWADQTWAETKWCDYAYSDTCLFIQNHDYDFIQDSGW